MNNEFVLRLANLTEKHKEQLQRLDEISSNLSGLARLGTITPEQIQEFIDTTQRYIQLLEAELPHWISVKERYPTKDSEQILVYLGRAEQPVYTVAFFFVDPDGTPWWYELPCQHRAQRILNTVTHWMPLPESPEGTVSGHSALEQMGTKD